MSSEVDICNLALSFLGDSANVVSINPPSGSAQAEHCQRYYPLARDSMLELHSWNFATRTLALAEVSNFSTIWNHAYALPSDFLVALEIIDPQAFSSFTYDPLQYPYFYSLNYASLAEVKNRYQIQQGADNKENLFTNVEDAQLKYISRIVDPSRFSPNFIGAVSWRLASMLAGVIIKSDEGAKSAQYCATMAHHYLNIARVADSNQRSIKMEHTAPWLQAR